jgi:hypothetical protein
MFTYRKGGLAQHKSNLSGWHTSVRRNTVGRRQLTTYFGSVRDVSQLLVNLASIFEQVLDLE